MSANNARLRILPPPVVRLGATVECSVQTTGDHRGTFHELLATTLNSRATAMEYSGVTFTLAYDEDGAFKRVFSTTELGQPMPDVFETVVFPIASVLIRCAVPDVIIPKPGHYFGYRHGYRAGQCYVDPTGELSETGTPSIYAIGNRGSKLSNSGVFDETQRLFVDVMCGRLAPEDR